MFGSALIVFREVLEAALIIGLVLAATRGIAGRRRWIGGGVAAGALGALLVAASVEAIAQWAQGVGQELFNAAVLLATVGLLAWHQIWMGRHGREMAREMRTLGQSVQEGRTALHTLSLVVGIAMLREGSEAALFLTGMAAGDGLAGSEVAAGALLGLAGGAACGAALYAGLLSMATHRLFAVTGWMLVLLAAGMAAQAASFLVQAGVLPALVDELWNASALLARGDALGQVLHVLVGYDDRPSGMQLLFYLVTVAAIGGVSRWMAAHDAGAAGSPRAA